MQTNKPSFARSINKEIDSHLVIIDATPRLLQELREVLDQFLEGRAERAGPPSKVERLRLQRIARALDAFVAACGPDVEATQRLIGQWAALGYLHDFTLVELVGAMCDLSHDISSRLSEPRRPRHRPKDSIFQDFCCGVVMALARAREPVPPSRGGAVDRIIRTLLRVAQQPVPVDLRREVSHAVRRYPAEVRRLKRAEAAFNEFD